MNMGQLINALSREAHVSPYARVILEYLDTLPNEVKAEKRRQIDKDIPYFVTQAFGRLARGSNIQLLDTILKGEDTAALYLTWPTGSFSLDLTQASIIWQIGRLLVAVTGQQNIDEDLHSYCFARNTVLSQAFIELVDHINHRFPDSFMGLGGSSGLGQFGTTTLRVGYGAARLMVTFARPATKDDRFAEWQITFIGVDDARSGGSFGIQSLHGPLHEALAMIEDVRANWPSTSDELAKTFDSRHPVYIR